VSRGRFALEFIAFGVAAASIIYLAHIF